MTNDQIMKKDYTVQSESTNQNIQKTQKMQSANEKAGKLVVDGARGKACNNNNNNNNNNDNLISYIARVT